MHISHPVNKSLVSLPYLIDLSVLYMYEDLSQFHFRIFLHFLIILIYYLAFEFVVIMFILLFTSGGDIKRDDCNNMDEEDEDESDDELLSPPAFLQQDYRVQSEVKTPEKCETLLACSPLTPISPFLPQKKDAVQCRYSLARLVLEKPKQVKKDKEMDRLQSAIHEQIEKGRSGICISFSSPLPIYHYHHHHYCTYTITIVTITITITITIIIPTPHVSPPLLPSVPP